ncbi:hypothetical protein SDJN03_14129, partial [Cucurbita argyrosperma subsp. sororia]
MCVFELEFKHPIQIPNGSGDNLRPIQWVLRREIRILENSISPGRDLLWGTLKPSAVVWPATGRRGVEDLPNCTIFAGCLGNL